jgi:hypothetical protein
MPIPERLGDEPPRSRDLDGHAREPDRPLARSYYCYDTQLVSGIFQTADYAGAVLGSSGPRTAVEIERGVEVRLARQNRLFASENPLDVWQIIEEAALRREVGSPDTMRAQLQHLLTLASLPNVSLKVLPYRAGVHSAIDGPFTLLEFDGYPDVLYIEHLMGCVYLEKPTETRQGSLVFNHLRASALNATDSASLIRTLIDDLP